jgi:hypothetical protein
MNAVVRALVVRALVVGTGSMTRIARLSAPLDPAAPLSPPSSKTRTRWRALQWVRKWT